MNFFRWLFDQTDPFRRGPLFTHYGLAGMLFLITGTWAMYAWITSSLPGWGAALQLFSIGVHEAGHPLFNKIFLGNFFMTIIGGTFMELFVPLAGFIYFLRRGKAISSDVCLLLLAIAFWSVGGYAGYNHDAVIHMLNATADTKPDWEYMHTWFHTWPYDLLIRKTCYALSAFFTTLGVWLIIQHFWHWTDPDKHRFLEDDSDHSFFLRH